MKTFTTATIRIALLGATSNAITIPCTKATSLRYEAQKQDILIGSGAINPSYLNDAQFSAVLAEQFNSLSSENELKWSLIHPTRGYYNWETLDRLVAFAKHNRMVVKGHGLISTCCNPPYLTNTINPTDFRALMIGHFDAIMQHYHGKMDRWDVVTEALETLGGGLQHNDFHNVLGPNYIEEAFRVAHAADPAARLFLNENLVESLSGKRQELYDLVSGLVASNTPIDGIALQMHITEVPVVPGVITGIVESYRALELEVTIAEMDVHTLNNTLETRIYGDVIREALAAGITYISFWGFTDKHAYTWVPGAQPLIFNANYTAKREFYAVHDALAGFANSRPPPSGNESL